MAPLRLMEPPRMVDPPASLEGLLSVRLRRCELPTNMPDPRDTHRLQPVGLRPIVRPPARGARLQEHIGDPAGPSRPGQQRPLDLLAQLTPNRPSGEDRAVDVHVVGRRILPDRLDEAAIDASGAS